MDENTFKEVINGLATDATSRNKRVDPSFAVELQNYKEHVGVRALDDDDAELVIQKIVGSALVKHEVLNGTAIRNTLLEMCVPTSGWDLCAKAARNILQSHSRAGGVKKLEADVAASLEKYRHE